MISLELVAGGESHVVRTAHIASDRVRTVGFALCENQATVLVRGAAGNWSAVLTDREHISQAVDFRRPSTLATLGFASGVRDGDLPIRAVRAGLFGMAGLRDPHVVQNADGTPYVRDGHLYLTWTCAGLGFFQQAHWGVFRMSLADPTNLIQVAQIYTSRDGLVLGDHAGQLVRDGDSWLIANSSWGDFDGSGVHVRWTRSSDDVLSGVHVIQTRQVPLPTSLSTWDPSFTRIDAGWVVAFIESPSQSPFDFHPALARTTSESPFEGLVKVGTDAGKHQTEGAILARDRDGWKLLASDGDARDYPVYDLEMRTLGRLQAPYGTNIPHPQVIPRPDGTWLLVTFDDTSYFSDVVGYGAHGSVITMQSR